jgi:carbonic anhydrase
MRGLFEAGKTHAAEAIEPPRPHPGAGGFSDPGTIARRLELSSPEDEWQMASTDPPCTADEALARLKEGNARFLRGQARFPTIQKDILADLTKGQQPYATILGCSDSRVPPELVFDAGFGELFVVRVAGNVLGPSILGTLQYAGSHLHTPLFVVMGHEGCGAVSAALASRFQGAQQKSRIELLLQNILPALDGLDSTLAAEDLLAAAVEANVRRTVRNLLETPEAKAALEAETGMKMVGAIYELGTGRVRFLE